MQDARKIRWEERATKSSKACGCPELRHVADLRLRLVDEWGMIRHWRCDWST